MNALLELVAPVDRTLVKARASQAVRDNDEWARGLLGSQGSRLCENLAFVLASITPALAPECLQLRMRFCLWTFLLDNCLDDPAASDAEVRGVERRVTRALAGQPREASGDVLVDTLTVLLGQLRQHDTDGVLLRHLVDD